MLRFLPCAVKGFWLLPTARIRPPMAAHGHHSSAPTQKLRGGEWRSVRVLLPYLMEFRGRVALALAFLISAKLANVSVPLVMKGFVDGLDP
jgi:hypothetical protein